MQPSFVLKKGACPALQIETSNRYFLGAMAVLAACTVAFGPLKMFNLYFMPYWINVIWLDVVTYLHHHGSEDPEEKLPWYRGKVGMVEHCINDLEIQGLFS